MIRPYDHFYDAQMKRFIMQVVRAFSGYQYATGRLVNGLPETKMVPCRYATNNRMAAELLKGGSDNALLAVPMITVMRTGVAMVESGKINMWHTQSLNVTERAKDPTTGRYTGERGQSYTVERYMGLPMEMTIQIDVWTSNMDQKDQLLEQMLIATAIPFDIQNSDNALDWTALTTMTLTDVTISSRSFPVGSEDEIDIFTLTYKLPFHLSPPAKITRQTLIEQIVANVSATTSEEDRLDPTSPPLLTRIVTPGDYAVAVQKGVVTLLSPGGSPMDSEGRIPSFRDLFQTLRHSLRPAQSQLRLRANLDDPTHDIVGTIQYHPDPNKLYWQPDLTTLPSNTLPPIDAIVRPLSHFPGSVLPAAAQGQRYLVVEAIGTSTGWGTVNAQPNDIIEYRNGVWVVVFHAASESSAFALNSSTATQLHWSGNAWEISIDGIYNAGEWRLLF